MTARSGKSSSVSPSGYTDRNGNFHASGPRYVEQPEIYTTERITTPAGRIELVFGVRARKYTLLRIFRSSSLTRSVQGSWSSRPEMMKELRKGGGCDTPTGWERVYGPESERLERGSGP